jgi:outer membrane biosynthesis protein TonB
MFEFAISRNQRQRPTERIIIACIASCMIHLLAFAILVINPGLLLGGRFHSFHGIALIPRIFSQNSKGDDEEGRVVTILRPMMAPSAETLKKYMYDWNKKGEGPLPVHVRWKDDPKIASNEKAMPMPKVPESKAPEISLPANEVVSSSPESGQGNQDSGSKHPGGVASGFPATAQKDPAKKDTMLLPPPGPATKTDISDNKAPSAIPDKTKLSIPQVRIFDNEKQAIKNPESGLFDTKGYPLGDYARKIIDRITGKWFIPSNLKNSQGHTTVVFKIDKEGRFSDTRIVLGSGNNSLDLTALNAIIESDPAQPLPKDFPGDHIGAKFVFSYNEP